jgi:hypothetical protein
MAIAAALIVATAPARAAEIDAMITTAMGAAIEELAPAFERASGHALRIVYGPPVGSLGASPAASRPISSSSRARCSTS